MGLKSGPEGVLRGVLQWAVPPKADAAYSKREMLSGNSLESDLEHAGCRGKTVPTGCTIEEHASTSHLGEKRLK